MQGFIIPSRMEDTTRIPLPKTKSLVVLINDQIHLIDETENHTGTPLFYTVWDKRTRTWIASKPEGGIQCSCRGNILTSAPTRLSAEHAIHVYDWGDIEYQSEIASPIYRGKTTNNLPLVTEDTSITIGRGTEDEANDNKLHLDSDDFTISKAQARLTHENNLMTSPFQKPKPA